MTHWSLHRTVVVSNMWGPAPDWPRTNVGRTWCAPKCLWDACRTTLRLVNFLRCPLEPHTRISLRGYLQALLVQCTRFGEVETLKNPASHSLLPDFTLVRCKIELKRFPSSRGLRNGGVFHQQTAHIHQGFNSNWKHRKWLPGGWPPCKKLNMLYNEASPQQFGPGPVNRSREILWLAQKVLPQNSNLIQK